jgi:hypothetical protein
MKKSVLIVAILLFMAVPAMAASTVTITCTHTHVGDVNWVTVAYDSNLNRIRAFGLDITLGQADGNIQDVCVLDPNFRIYPGQIEINDNGEVTDYNKPYSFSDINDANNNIAVEMGTLYTLDSNYSSDPNWGYRTTPPSKSGNLLKFSFKNACDYTVDVNVRRGGIVMEDPNETPNKSSPLCSGTVPWGDCPEEVVLDFGDANDTYQTLKASNGPNHIAADTGPILGSNRDTEADGQPSANCLLDDNTGVPDDEDGITLLVATPAGGSVTVTVSQAAGKLDAWVDFNNDGDFADAGEQIFASQNVAIGPNPLVFVVPADPTVVMNTQLVSRWRVSTAGGLNYYGAASDGEVEDYKGLEVTCGTCPLDVAGWEGDVPDGYVAPEDLFYVLSLINGCAYRYCDVTTLPPAQKCLDVAGWEGDVPDGYVAPEDLFYVLSLINGCDYRYCTCP